MKTIFARALVLLTVTSISTGAFANEQPQEIGVEIKGHQFIPAEVKVPAGKAFVLLVKNSDATVEEFESKTLKIEKIIQPQKEVKIHVRALEKGSYPFVGEFHEDTTKGTIIAE